MKRLAVLELDNIIPVKMIKLAFTNVAFREDDINWTNLGVLLYGRANLLMVYKGVCHQLEDRTISLEALEDFLTADESVSDARLTRK